MKTVLVTSPHLNHAYYLAEHEAQSATLQRPLAQTFVPMGLLSLVGAAKPSFDVGVADINKALNGQIVRPEHSFYEDTAEWLLEQNPDVIGFMTECDSYHHLIQICRQIKKQRPSAITALGGVCASTNHYETIRRFDAVDYIVRNEGEVAFPEFLEGLAGKRPLEKAHNLTYRAGSNVRVSDELPLIADLDTLPFPDLSVIDVSPEDAVWVEIGRGCPFKCNFCVTAPYWKRRHRIKSPARIIAELEYFRDRHGRTDFNFTHDLFTTDRRWVLRFCQALHAANIGVTWTCSSRTDTIDDEQIHWLKKAGCRDIYFGVEAGTASMQARIDKNLDLGEADRVIKKVLDEGIGATVGFIVGLPGESSTNLRGTLDKAHEYLGSDRTTVHLFGFGPYRGSAHFDKILPQLVFDPFFIDFPVSDRSHDENCSFMEEHFEVFTRYSRLRSYDDVGLGVIRAAEEYLPIINALRDLVALLLKRGVASYDMLVSWSQWVETKNAADNKPRSRIFYGTIRQYICFLREFCQSRNVLDEVVEEALRWEELKDEVRRLQAVQTRPSLPQDAGPGRYFTNPTVKIDTFEHLHATSLVGRGEGVGQFAFFITQAGVPQIVHLNPLAAVALEAGRRGISPEAFGREVQRAVHSDQEIPGSDIAEMFDHLATLNLLLHSSTPLPH
ncbi:MAG: radical SAM protein [Reyranella sp.]|nr:radical SAM protein [Reyranella sp.]MDP3158656.1 radical SAM protein [Reyranella sp.]